MPHAIVSSMRMAAKGADFDQSPGLRLGGNFLCFYLTLGVRGIIMGVYEVWR